MAVSLSGQIDLCDLYEFRLVFFDLLDLGASEDAVEDHHTAPHSQVPYDAEEHLDQRKVLSETRRPHDSVAFRLGDHAQIFDSGTRADRHHLSHIGVGHTAVCLQEDLLIGLVFDHSRECCL